MQNELKQINKPLLKARYALVSVLIIAIAVAVMFGLTANKTIKASAAEYYNQAGLEYRLTLEESNNKYYIIYPAVVTGNRILDGESCTFNGIKLEYFDPIGTRYTKIYLPVGGKIDLSTLTLNYEGTYSVRAVVEYVKGTLATHYVYGEMTYFTLRIIESGDSNKLEIQIDEYDTPSIKQVGTSYVFTEGQKYGTFYKVCVGDFATNEIVNSKIISWTERTVLMSDELFTSLPKGSVYDVWAYSMGGGFFKDSPNSDYMSLVFYDDIELKVNNSMLSFDRVNGATDYTVTVQGDNYSKTNEFTSIEDTVFYDLVNFDMDIGIYSVSVMAKADNAAVFSASNTIYMSFIQLDAPVIYIEDYYLKWDAVTYAKGYRIYYNDTYVDTTETEYNLLSLNLALGSYTIKVRSIGNAATPARASLRTISTVFTQMIALNYNVNGDLTQELIAYGSSIKLPNVTLDGYTFDGWYYDREFTQKAEETDIMTNNAVLYSKFTAIDDEEVPLTVGQKIWNVAKPILIWGGVIIGVLLVGGVVFLIIKKKRG